jgi:dTDP-4-dehydrorhamnose reductase
VSWHGLATAVVEEMAAAGLISTIPEIAGQSLANMSAFRADRPQFTALVTDRLASLLRRPPRPWRDALAAYILSRCSAR